MAASICERIALGESLRAICRDEGMPDQSTVHRWLSQDEEFASKCARARELQGDTMFDRVGDTVDKTESGALAPDQARVVISGLQWMAAKLKPKKYGERLEVDSRMAVAHYLVEVPAVAETVDTWLTQNAKLSGGHSLAPKQPS